MTKRIVKIDGIDKLLPGLPESMATAVIIDEQKGLFYATGIVGFDLDSFELRTGLKAQCVQALKNLDHFVTKAGMQLGDVTQMTILFVSDTNEPRSPEEDFRIFLEAKNEVASGLVAVGIGARVPSLMLKPALIEIMVTGTAP